MSRDFLPEDFIEDDEPLSVDEVAEDLAADAQDAAADREFLRAPFIRRHHITQIDIDNAEIDAEETARCEAEYQAFLARRPSMDWLDDEFNPARETYGEKYAHPEQDRYLIPERTI